MDAKLNNDLLKASSDDEKKERPKKRNSKEELIEKIMQVAEHNTIPIPHSDTRLKRMTKQQLNELLAGPVKDLYQNLDDAGVRWSIGRPIPLPNQLPH